MLTRRKIFPVSDYKQDDIYRNKNSSAFLQKIPGHHHPFSRLSMTFHDFPWPCLFSMTFQEEWSPRISQKRYTLEMAHSKLRHGISHDNMSDWAQLVAQYIIIERKKEKQRNSELWQGTYVPRPPTLRYPHQSCQVGWGPGRSQPCQVSSKSIRGFCLPKGSKSATFLCSVLWVIYKVTATAQPITDS